MNLEDKMKKWKTINGPNCKRCGNPWFFQKEQSTECTTCGHKKVETMTVQKQWENFAAKVYPGKDHNIEQMRQLKATWFAAYFDFIMLLNSEIVDLPEDQAMEAVKKLTQESKEFVREYIQQERARQDAGIRP